MTRSMKTPELKMVSANGVTQNEFDSLKDSVTVRRNESWLHKVSSKIRSAFYGITIATMLFLSSEGRAQEIPDVPTEPGEISNKHEPDVPVVAPQEVGGVSNITPSKNLKEAYVSYKRGKLSEADFGVKLAREAAQIVKEQKLDSKEFAKVISTLKMQLESWCNCNDECSGASQKKAVKPLKKKGSATVLKKDVSKGVKEEAKESPKEISIEEYEKKICDLAKKEGTNLERCGATAAKEEGAPQKVVIIKRTDESKEEPAAPAKEDKGEEDKSDGTGNDRVIEANMVRDAWSESVEKEGVVTAEESGKKEDGNKNFELVVPMLGRYSKVLGPYRDDYLKSLSGSTPVVMGALLNNPYFGLSWMGGYAGHYEGFNSFSDTVYTRHSSLVGAGILLRLGETSIHTLLTMDGAFKEENVGLLLLVNSSVFNMSLTAPFGKDRERPSELALQYWNAGSSYPLILEVSGSLKDAKDNSIGAKYRINDLDALVQIPLTYGSGSGVYPNLVLGGKYYNMNANPNEKIVVGGKIGGSITYEWLNIGAVYIPAYGSYTRFLFDEEGTYIDKNGDEYYGQLRKTRKYIDGFGVFANVKVLGSENWYFTTGLTYEIIGSSTWVTAPFVLQLRW